MTGPCAWPIDRASCCLPDAATTTQIAQRDAALDIAVQVLDSLSGRQYGVCPTIIRPCPTTTCSMSGTIGTGWLNAYLDGGVWRNHTCGCAGNTCERANPSTIHLPGPVQSITTITIDGTVIDPTSYTLEGNYLLKADCTGWPSQNLGCPAGEPGTWTVEYMRGTPPPAGVAVLVGKLAAEFIAACAGGKCHLPRRVTQVTRNGVTMNMVDPTSIYDEGITGIPEVDTWIKAVNPHRVQRAPRVR